MSDMTELFMRDPLQLTDEDITKIIAHYREARATFRAAPSAVKKAPASKLTAGQKAATSALNLTLDL